VAASFIENAVLACFDNQWPNFLTQTVALGFAFGGQSQLLSKPMLLSGPYGGRPAAVQMTKPHMNATVAQSRMVFSLMSNSRPPQLAASYAYTRSGYPGTGGFEDAKILERHDYKKARTIIRRFSLSRLRSVLCGDGITPTEFVINAH
jgi:hypothetical protein